MGSAVDIRNELDGIVRKYDLVERTIRSFWANYDCYLEEEPEEARECGVADRDSIKAEFYGYYFGASNDLDFDHIKVYVDGIREGDTIRTITYWCIYSLDGKVFDDYFVID